MPSPAHGIIWTLLRLKRQCTDARGAPDALSNFQPPHMQSYRRGRVASCPVTCIRRGAAARACAPFSWGGAGSRCLLACFPTGDDALPGTALPLPPLPRASCLAATRLPSPSTAARRPTEFAKDREGPSSPSSVVRRPLPGSQTTHQPTHPSTQDQQRPTRPQVKRSRGVRNGTHLQVAATLPRFPAP